MSIPLPMESAASSRFTSERLTPNNIYTGISLRHLFNTSEPVVESGVFRPGGFNSIWLFVTEQVVRGTGSYSCLDDEDTLIWQGQVSGRTDQLIIGHEERGLELLLFYRTGQGQFTGGGFRYMGRFEYQSHSGKPPTTFVLTRAGKAPSIAEIQTKLEKTTSFDPATVREGREWVLASIVRRRGQAAFRLGLLKAYAGRCAITGCTVEPILEAAHIIPYSGSQTHHIQNGLLLRADIHTLFDLLLLAIDPDTYTVSLSTVLQASEYNILSGSKIILPENQAYQPSVAALRAHRIRCDF